MCEQPPWDERCCRPQSGDTQRLSDPEITRALAEVTGWDRNGDELIRRFQFADYHQTMAFVNALAWIAHDQDHHPNLEVGYRTCAVHFTTHSVGGLSENDFICAARVNRLVTT